MFELITFVVCGLAFACANRVIAHVTPPGSFERVAANGLAFAAALSLGLAVLLIGAPR